MSINVVPIPYIIAESFPIESSIRGYFTTVGKNSFFTDLEEKNQGKDNKVGALEKTLEVNGNVLGELGSSDTKNNKEYLLKLGNKSALDHSTITVLFNNISLGCIQSLREYELHYAIDKEEIKEELKFWISPGYATQELMLMFRDLFGRFNNLKKNLVEKFKITDKKELERVYPLSAATNCVYTTGIEKWKELLVAGTAFNENSECRYVLIELAKLFKARYPNAFIGMCLIDKDLKTYGMDTLKSGADAWQFYRIIFSN
jgi:hypothetical protein